MAAAYDAWARRAAAPDAVLLFHPGFWGYASWRPTLRALLRGGAPWAATAYTPEEADADADAVGAAALDDADAGEAAAEAAADALPWLWRCEANPHASNRPRPTAGAPEGHAYRENRAWSAVRARAVP